MMSRRQSLLQTRVDPATAARVRLQAERARVSISEWIAQALRREVQRAGAADVLAVPTLEAVLTLGYMVRVLMVNVLGNDATQRAIALASETAEEEAAEKLEAADEELPP